MSRSQSTLETELNNLALYDTEAAAITAWADAFAIYFADAETTTGGTVLAAGVTAAKSAMAAAMTGLSTSGAAAIAAGVTAFWNTGVSAPATWFAAATVITAPTALAGLQAALETTFALNISEKVSKAVAMGRIASDLHTACNGGTATFPGPVVETIN